MVASWPGNTAVCGGSIRAADARGKVTAEQTLKFAESLARGEPNRMKITLTAVSKVRD